MTASVIYPAPTAVHEADVVALATAVIRRLEQLILASPGQYLWIHNRYRTVPPEVRREARPEVPTETTHERPA